MKTAIIGTGNPLWGDDGLGVYMAQNPPPDLPSDVSLIDGGTAGVDLLRFFQEYDRLVVLDAVKHGGEPGDIVVFRPRETGEIQRHDSLSAHALDLSDVLSLAELMDYRAEVVIVGCEPFQCTAGERLSDPIKEAIPKMWTEVQRELRAANDVQHAFFHSSFVTRNS
ncbi:MAG: HyaD/HybD family hydrogenase maturation endopeptidase [bacterium]